MKKELNIIGHRWIPLTISAILVAASLVLFFTWGLKLGIDFTGGALLEVKFTENVPVAADLKASIDQLQIEGEVSVQSTEGNGYIIRLQNTDEAVHQGVLAKLGETFKGTDAAKPNVYEVRYESIGPAIGAELRTKSFYTIVAACIFIILYVAWSFRKVSHPVQSWKYGVAAVIALFHDVIITVGFFCILGKFFNIDVGVSFVAALLTILGYSVNDTIVVFDRTRENLMKLPKLTFEAIVNRSINETFGRSVNTSVTVMIVLLALILLVPGSIQYFALALFFGVFVGTYSSIFLASPLLVIWEKRGR